LLKKKIFSSLMDGSIERLKIFYFLFFGSLACSVFLILQRTVRLEVERTWHWYFFCVWPLSFLILRGAQVAYQKYHGEKRPIHFKIKFLMLSLQMVVTWVLVLSFQDYY